MEGRLHKQTQRAFLQELQERWFVCRGAELPLWESDTPSAAPAKTIDLGEVDRCAACSTCEFHIQYKDSRKAPYRLRAKSKELATQWIDVLRSRLGGRGGGEVLGSGQGPSASAGDEGDHDVNSGASSETKTGTDDSVAGEENSNKGEHDHAIASYFAAAGAVGNTRPDSGNCSYRQRRRQDCRPRTKIDSRDKRGRGESQRSEPTGLRQHWQEKACTKIRAPPGYHHCASIKAYCLRSISR